MALANVSNRKARRCRLRRALEAFVSARNGCDLIGLHAHGGPRKLWPRQSDRGGADLFGVRISTRWPAGKLSGARLRGSGTDRGLLTAR